MLRKRHRPDWVQTLARELGRAIRPSSVFHALFRLVQALRCRDPDTGKALRGERSGKRENTSQHGESRQYWQSDAALNAIDCFTPVCAGRRATKHPLALPTSRADYVLRVAVSTYRFRPHLLDKSLRAMVDRSTQAPR